MSRNPATSAPCVKNFRYLHRGLTFATLSVVPTYEYECPECKTTFEADQKISDPPLTECTREGCAGGVRRMISGSTSFTLKGAGWARDGYRRE